MAVVALALVAAQIAEIPWRNALRGYDNTFNYLWLHSLWFDGDWQFVNDVTGCPTLFGDSRTRALELIDPQTGHLLNKYGVGWSVVTVPAFAVADGLVLAGNCVGVWSLPRDGWNPVYQICILLWHAGLAVAALGFTRAILRRFIVEPWASVGIMTVWLASPLPYYQMGNVGMSHGPVFFAVALAAWALLRADELPARRWPWWLAGAGLGLATICRFQAGVFGLLGCWALGRCGQRAGGRAALAAGVRLALGAAPWLALQALAWHAVYGRWLVFSYGAEGESFAWLRPAWWPALLSPRHGLYYWHPLLALATGGLVLWAWTQRGAALAALSVVLATVYLNAAWWCWWFGAAFGSRAFDGALIALMAGQGFLFARAGRHGRRALWLVCGLLAGWNGYVLVLYRSGTIPRNDPVTWLEMLRAAPKLWHELGF